jgi:dihydropyrimidinase
MLRVLKRLLLPRRDVMVNSGLATASDFVRVTSTEAARIFNLYPQKGVIMAGSDADVVLFDPVQAHTLSAASAHGRIDTSLWEGRRVLGRVVTTISRGRVLWHDGVLSVEPNTGRFVPARPFGSLYSGASVAQAAARAAERDFPEELLGATPVKRAGDVVPVPAATSDVRRSGEL